MQALVTTATRAGRSLRSPVDAHRTVRSAAEPRRREALSEEGRFEGLPDAYRSVPVCCEGGLMAKDSRAKRQLGARSARAGGPSGSRVVESFGAIGDLQLHCLRPSFPWSPAPRKTAPGRADTREIDTRLCRQCQARTRPGRPCPWRSVETDGARHRSHRPGVVRICPWTPQHAGLQRLALTHGGTTQNSPHSR
jgi:hypothetical protein